AARLARRAAQVRVPLTRPENRVRHPFSRFREKSCQTPFFRSEGGWSMELGLKGKNAAITGSSQGLGYAIATAPAKAGCTVALSARGRERLERAVAELEALGVTACGIVADLSTEDGCRAFADATAEKLGGIDILVNNVGGMIPGHLETMSAAQWSTALNVNLMAAVYTTKYALRHLKQSRAARILNVSGVTGKQLMPGTFSTTIPNAGIIA